MPRIRVASGQEFTAAAQMHNANTQAATAAAGREHQQGQWDADNKFTTADHLLRGRQLDLEDEAGARDERSSLLDFYASKGDDSIYDLMAGTDAGSNLDQLGAMSLQQLFEQLGIKMPLAEMGGQ